MAERPTPAGPRRLRARLRTAEVGLILPRRGELTAKFAGAFTTLEPLILGCSGSRPLWDAATLVPCDAELHGHLPTRKFLWDEGSLLAAIAAHTRELMTLKRATKRPFIRGPECSVVSVPGAVEIIRRTLEAVVNVEVP